MSEQATPIDTATEEANKKRKDRVEFIAAIIIGIAAVLTAVATFQGSQVDGEVQEKHTEALQLTLLANDAFNDYNAELATERDWFFSFVTENENDTPASEFLIEAMPSAVYELWLEWVDAPDDVLDPFSPEADYKATANLASTGRFLDGQIADLAAECAVFASRVADVRGENYGLSTVFLAISLVVGGIAALLTSKAPQIIVLVVSALSLVAGASVLALAGDEQDARAEQALQYFPFDDDGNELSADQALVEADMVCPVDG